MLQTGIYEQLINRLIATKLNELGRDSFFIKETPVDKSEAARILSLYLADVIRLAMNLISGEDKIEKQIGIRGFAKKIAFLFTWLAVSFILSAVCHVSRFTPGGDRANVRRFFFNGLRSYEINKFLGLKHNFPREILVLPEGEKAQGFSLKTRFQREENSILVHLGTTLKLKL